MSDVDEGVLGQLIGQQIGANARNAGMQALAAAENASLEQEATAGALVVGLLRRQVDDLTQTEISYKCAIAGVRGVTRELLEELRKSDPKNPMLDKKLRDRIFDATFEVVNKKIPKTSYQQRQEQAQAWRDEAYGATGANKGGPEKHQITPNLAVRAEAEVPSHVTDREKLLELLERTTAELRRANPDAEVLKDKAMVEALEDYTLNDE